MKPSSSEFFQTLDVDIVAFLHCRELKIVSVHRSGDRVEFAFQDTPELHRAVSAFHSGATVEAKQLLHSRQHVWRLLTQAKSGGALWPSI